MIIMIMKIELKDLRSAVADFTTVTSLDPQYSYAWFNRGRVEVLLNDNQSAMKDIEQSIRLNPSFGDAYVVLGNIKFNNGDKSGACDVWKKGADVGNQICINNLHSFCR